LSDAKDWIGGANKNSDEEQYVITLTDGTLIGACGIEVRDEAPALGYWLGQPFRSEEHTSELQSLTNLVCRLLLEKKKKSADHRIRGYAGALQVTQGRQSDVHGPSSRQSPRARDVLCTGHIRTSSLVDSRRTPDTV